MLLRKLYFSSQLLRIARESVTGVKLQIETGDENLVARGDPSCNSAEAGGHLFRFDGFQIVIDEHNKRERESLGSENIDRLFNLVIENSKLMLLKVRNQLTVAIFDSYRQDYQIRIDGYLSLSLTLRNTSLVKNLGTEESNRLRPSTWEDRSHTENYQHAQYFRHALAPVDMAMDSLTYFDRKTLPDFEPRRMAHHQ